MISSPAFYVFCLLWFFGWGFAFLKYPTQTSRLLSRGEEPSAQRLRMARIIGYLGIFFGGLVLLELVLGIVRWPR